MGRVEIWTRLLQRRAEQNEKHEFPDCDFRRLSILLEEVGEVAQCLNDHESPDRLIDELVDAIAVGVRWLENL